LLELVYEQGIGDKIAMDVKGPAALYPTMLDEKVDSGEIEKSMSLVAKFLDYKFIPPSHRLSGNREKIRTIVT